MLISPKLCDLDPKNGAIPKFDRIRPMRLKDALKTGRCQRAAKRTKIGG